MFQTNSTNIIKQFIANTLFPKSCYGCGEGDSYLCYECAKKSFVSELSCPHCNARVPFGKLNENCKRILGVNNIFISFDYKDDVIKKMIYDFKYNNCFILSEDFINLSLCYLNNNKLLKNIDKDKTIIVPVPSHKTKKRRRGFNPAEKLAIQLSDKEGIKMYDDFLIKIKNTPPQAGIKNSEERKVNNNKSFYCNEKDIPKSTHILLVDDVYTTGSTIRECVRTLKGAGYKNISAFAVSKN